MDTLSTRTMPLQPAGGHQDDALERAFTTLGPAWTVLRCCSPGNESHTPSGCVPYILLHPAVGVALLDLLPDITPGAATSLRKRLDGAGFGLQFPGYLPVVHRVLPMEHLSRLPDVLDYAFALEPALTVADGDGWTGAVQDILSGGPAHPATAAPFEDDAAAPKPEPARQADHAGPADRLHRFRAILGMWGVVLLAFGLGATVLAYLGPPERRGPALSMDQADGGEAELRRQAAAIPHDDGAAAPASQTRSPEPTDAAAPAGWPVAADPEQAEAAPQVDRTRAVAAGPDPGPVPAAAAPLMPATTPAADPAPRLPGLEPCRPARVPGSVPTLPPSTIEALLRRGNAMLALGDVSAARLLYERAAAAGSGQAATAVGKTHDPAVLAALGVRGLGSDRAVALAWYRKAAALGDAEAEALLAESADCGGGG